MTKATPNPLVLKWARETLNMSIEDVARRIQRDPADVAAWELGEARPTYVQLESLAYSVYKRPLAVFFFPNPPKEEDLKKSFRTLPDFELKKLSPVVMRIIRRARSMRLRLADLCGGACPSERRVLDGLSLTPLSSATKAAASLREYLDISLDEQFSWRSNEKAFAKWRIILERAGVFVFKDAFHQDEISGFCLYDSDFPIIYVNNSLASARQIFTLFHELAHLGLRTGGIDKLHDDYIPALSAQDGNAERLCNAFAASFLVPDSDFGRRTKGQPADENQINRLADLYSVSREVILRKFFDRGLVASSTYERLAAQWADDARRSRGRRQGGDYYATQKAYLGETYLNLVLGAYYKKTINAQEFAEFLNMKIDTAKELESRL